MKSAIVGSILITAVIVALISDTVGTLLFGWVGYLARVLPRLDPDPPTVLVSLAAAGLVMLGFHWLGRGWAGRRAIRWKWRWSAAATLMLFVLFAAAVAMVGVVHMGLWYATDPEPLRASSLWTRIAGRVKTSNNLKQLGLAIHNHYSTGSSLPAAATFTHDGQALHGWELEIMPFLQYDTRRVDRTLPWDDPKNAPVFHSVLPDFLNPSLPDAPFEDEHGFGLTHYAANNHVLKAERSVKFEEMTDGMANTFLVGEINANFPPWGRPMNVRDPARGINRSSHGFGGPPYAGGAQMLMADGSVRFVSDKVSPDVLRALATPAGGEGIGADALGK